MANGGSRESSAPLIVTAIVLTAGVGGFFWWQKQQKAAEPLPAPPAVLPAAPIDAAPAPPPVPDAAPPAPSHPLPGVPRGELPPLDEADGHVTKLLDKLLGKKNVLSFLALDGAIRRFVSTVDNLANEQAPARLWPVKSMPGNFTVEPRDGAPGASNARRYAAFVRFAEAVDSRRAVGIYVHLYPLFQQAYDELGYGGKSFHDRVIQVIDHLLATPDLSDPARVRLVEAKGATKPL
ncbi:MAG TPA: DUF3014 domain-containing protein, partial [Polyangia bacterium]